ncbi:hypothetical protein ACWEH1_18690 [Micromonospora chersina]
MIPAFVAAAAALAGVLIGQLLNRDAEYRKWLRSEQHLATAKFLAAARRAALLWEIEASIRKRVFDAADSSAPVADVRAAAERLAQDIGNEGLRAGPEYVQLIDSVVHRVIEQRRKEKFSQARDLFAPDLPTWIRRQEEVAHEVTSAQSALALVCPDYVTTASLVLVTLLSSLHDDRTLDLPSWKKEYFEATNSFVAAARRSLGTRGRNM